MTDIKIKIEVDVELFEKFKQFEKKYGFYPCQLAHIVQNDIELPIEDVFNHITQSRKAVREKYQNMNQEFNQLMEQLDEHILKLNPNLYR